MVNGTSVPVPGAIQPASRPLEPPGQYVPLSLPRRLICDLLYFARKLPTVPVERRLNVQALRLLRSKAASPPSWCAIFLKAYALVMDRFPELRRAYLPVPWPHLYQHGCSIASVAIERRLGDEAAVLFAQIRCPEQQTLEALEAYLRRFKEKPVQSIRPFRRALNVSRLPLPLRRLLWWVGLHTSGPRRARRMGTFGISVYSSLGAESLHPLSPLTTTLNYGVIQENGEVAVRLIYDHRVMDGATVARALAAVEEVLNHEIVAELQSVVTVRPRWSDYPLSTQG